MSRKKEKRRGKQKQNKKRGHSGLDQQSSIPIQVFEHNRLTGQTLPKINQLIFDGQISSASWPSISLCMIVKNEVKNLAECLESVENLADEIIIVDTGSTDDTVEIAQSFGAIVRHFTWIDDFAAARNESIREVKGEWIFWMDADDRISPDNLIRLKQAAASGQADAYICQIISQASGIDQSTETISHLRLFRNEPGLHFEHPIHEQITPVAQRLGLTIARTNITIEHTGYAASNHTLKKKAWRNLDIIKQCLKQEPNNLYWRFHRGINLYTLEAWASAAEDFEMVLANPPAGLELDNQIYEAYTLLIAAYANMRCPDKADQTLSQVLSIFSQRKHLWILTGKFYLSQNRVMQAIQALEHAQTLPSKANSIGMSWPAGVLETYLTQAYFRQGQHCYQQEDYNQMAELFMRAVEIAPPSEQVKALKFLAFALQKIGQENEAIQCWQTAQQLELDR